MKTFMFTFGLVLWIALSVASIWFLDQRTLSVTVVRAREEAKNVAAETKDFVQAKADSLDLSTTNIKAELARAGAIKMRRKTADAGDVIADTTADARITAAIKGKLVADAGLLRVEHIRQHHRRVGDNVRRGIFTGEHSKGRATRVEY